MTGAGSLSPCLQPVMEIRFNLFLSAASFERSTRMLLPVRYQFLGALHAGRGTSQAIAMMQMLAEGGARGALSALPARPRSLVRGDKPARGQPKTRRPCGLRAGSPPSPPPRLIRPIVRRLPRSPRLSGPGPLCCHSAAVLSGPMLPISAIAWNSGKYSCRCCESHRTTREFVSSLAI